MSIDDQTLESPHPMSIDDQTLESPHPTTSTDRGAALLDALASDPRAVVYR